MRYTAQGGQLTFIRKSRFDAPAGTAARYLQTTLCRTALYWKGHIAAQGP